MRENKIFKTRMKTWLEILSISTRLGLTSFGGPAAHLGYFHNEYIQRRKWMDDKSYADLVALCQFLPGPASSQVGLALGIVRGGFVGGLLAWIGFTLPSMIALVLFALLLQGTDISNAGWIHGLKVAAVAVVAQAVLTMGKTLAPDRIRATIVAASAIITLVWPTVIGQLAIIIVAGMLGLVFHSYENKEELAGDSSPIHINISRSMAFFAWFIFFALLVMLPVLSQMFSYQWLAVFDSFYRVGSLVFGGGHVVLPLLEKEVVPAGWINEMQFLAGYGAAQAVPGPLFTFAAYIGAIMNGWSGAFIATAAIFLPSFLMITGSLPLWEQIRRRPKFRSALYGINAAVVGILLAALYNPLWTSTINNPVDFSFAAILFVMLTFWKWPSWAVVIAASVGGVLLSVI